VFNFNNWWIQTRLMSFLEPTIHAEKFSNKSLVLTLYLSIFVYSSALLIRLQNPVNIGLPFSWIVMDLRNFFIRSPVGQRLEHYMNKHCTNGTLISD
jgi:hypothetical protein